MKRRTILWTATILLARNGAAHAIATQEEMFKSINSSVSEPIDPTRMIAGLLMVITVIVVAAVLTNRYKKKPGRPTTINSGARLFKEMVAVLRLRPGQVRQLKQLATEKNVESPLTLLLCPSLRMGKVSQAGDSAR